MKAKYQTENEIKWKDAYSAMSWPSWLSGCQQPGLSYDTPHTHLPLKVFLLLRRWESRAHHLHWAHQLICSVKGTQRKWNAKIRWVFSKILRLQNRGCWKRNTPQKAFKNIITEIVKISERVGNKIEELSQKEQNVKMMENRRENPPTKTRGSMQKVQDSHIRGCRNKQRRKKLKEMNLQV